METPWLWLIPLLPAFGAMANGLLHARSLAQRAAGAEGAPDEKTSGALGTAAVAAAFVVACVAFVRMAGLPEGERVLTATLGRWIDTGAVSVSWTLSVDPLGAVLMLVVTGVSALIHLYSVGYMHGDAGFSKYFAFLNLFVAMMLLLVLSESILGLFLGWEGVGLCSYLLIGFWYQDGEKADAAQKAFIVNRVGDLAFLVGVFLLFWGGAGTLSLQGINAAAPSLPPALATAAGLCLFLGCCGKSAQIPLHVWLPDAMAGPTPVSALIHAATMVTAGVYLIARLSPFFAAAPGVLPVVAVVGALTALFAATVALTQRDIKKVLAYSTVSQLGYMFLALGVGAFSAGVFHLVTHAFFKALLFLGAGSVIHALHQRQDLFQMGGLKGRIPVTYGTFLVGALALAGIPLFSGFFSKDEILFEAATGAHAPWLLWLAGAIGALLTAIYTGRLLTLAFFGKPRFDEREVHVHESPATMTVPLAVLALLSVLGGLLGLPFVMHPLAAWLEPVTGAATEALRGSHEAGPGLEAALMALGGAVALGGVWFGIRRFSADPEAQAARAAAPRGFWRLPANAWFVDAAYAAFVVLPLKTCASLCALFDMVVIDGLVNLAARTARDLAGFVRRLQTGGAHDYALWLALGSAAVLTAFYLGAG